METYRFRKLTTHREAESYEGFCDYCQKMHPMTVGWDEVDAHEDVAEQDVLFHRLETGALAPSDLVFSQGAWRSFSDAPESGSSATARSTRASSS